MLKQDTSTVKYALREDIAYVNELGEELIVLKCKKVPRLIKCSKIRICVGLSIDGSIENFINKKFYIKKFSIHCEKSKILYVINTDEIKWEQVMKDSRLFCTTINVNLEVEKPVAIVYLDNKYRIVLYTVTLIGQFA